MRQDAKELQQRAVTELHALADNRHELTFRAPTGSGKTHMMADLMQRVLAEKQDVVFLVSSLSKGDLARQNYEAFRRLADNGTFPLLRPYLINTELAGEEGLHIPTDYNIYVLPRDLYKKGGRLMQGAMQGFLLTMTIKKELFRQGQGKQIYLIKDECHQATNNLDDLSEDFFTRIFNFSATPNLKRGQSPDVQITDEEAVQTNLIKRIELCEDPNVPVDAAIAKLLEVQEGYRNLLGVNPCLIIQISNKDKAEEEWTQKILPALNKHQELKWMKIMDKEKDCDTNDTVKKKLPVRRWKDYAREANSQIDVIIFKLTISEGWDIPRACMLYQMRDTKSKQLDEQVVGRVRRNPRLLDFETLSPEAQKLAMTAWVWGLRPKDTGNTQPVTLWEQTDLDIRIQIRVKTTRIANLVHRKDFCVESVLKPFDNTASTDIFTLYHKLARSSEDVQAMCYDYADNNIRRWWQFAEQCDSVQRKFNNYINESVQSMETGEYVSFPVATSYTDTDFKLRVSDWVWQKQTGSMKNLFAFDSEAEMEWAGILQEVAEKYGKPVLSRSGVAAEPSHFLWGKNFPQGSNIRYEYYNEGIHASYPDFILKDREGRIHLFEVKSVNRASGSAISEDEYKQKIVLLSKCYKDSSRLLHDHIFYLPVMRGSEWHIHRFKDGEESVISEVGFHEELKSGN